MRQTMDSNTNPLKGSNTASTVVMRISRAGAAARARRAAVGALAAGWALASVLLAAPLPAGAQTAPTAGEAARYENLHAAAYHGRTAELRQLLAGGRHPMPAMPMAGRRCTSPHSTRVTMPSGCWPRPAPTWVHWKTTATTR